MAELAARVSEISVIRVKSVNGSRKRSSLPNEANKPAVRRVRKNSDKKDKYMDFASQLLQQYPQRLRIRQLLRRQTQLLQQQQQQLQVSLKLAILCTHNIPIPLLATTDTITMSTGKFQDYNSVHTKKITMQLTVTDSTTTTITTTTGMFQKRNIFYYGIHWSSLDTASTTTKTTAATTTTTTTTTLPTCTVTCLNQTWLSNASILGKWHFENNYADEFNLHNGVASGSPNLTFVQGYAGLAISFVANSNQMVSTSYIPLANISFSIDAWIYPTGLSNALHQSICGLCPTAAADQCLHMTLRLTSSSYPLYFGLYNDDVNTNTPATLTKIWVHAAFVYDGKNRTLSVYRNGIFLSGGSTSSGLKATSGSFQIGNLPVLVPTINTWQGYIDELSVSGRLKSACEILEQATLAARFSFDGSSPLLDLGPNSIASHASNYSLVSGRTLQAISFTGTSSSFLQTSGFLALGIANQPFSFSLWVKPQSLAGTIVHVSTNSSGTGFCAPFIGFSSNGSLIVQMMTNTSYVAISYSSLSLIEFTHIVQTWSSTNGLRLYINNALVGSIAAATYRTASTWVNYVTLGGCLNGCGSCSAVPGNQILSGPFAGAMDDFRVYSREVTASDVCNLYVYS
ncbi:unnamed protein product [Adineta steineri]|uniref:LamG-like jellyroll fold domain-containing protein n=1 Tax=Adineta steineri TaxID=433720 RepID=A0A819T0I6_9BILA|nr:unnamed protein product [Adineta steineri]